MPNHYFNASIRRGLLLNISGVQVFYCLLLTNTYCTIIGYKRKKCDEQTGKCIAPKSFYKCKEQVLQKCTYQWKVLLVCLHYFEYRSVTCGSSVFCNGYLLYEVVKCKSVTIISQNDCSRKTITFLYLIHVSMFFATVTFFFDSSCLLHCYNQLSTGRTCWTFKQTIK